MNSYRYDVIVTTPNAAFHPRRARDLGPGHVAYRHQIRNDCDVTVRLVVDEAKSAEGLG